MMKINPKLQDKTAFKGQFNLQIKIKVWDMFAFI